MTDVRWLLWLDDVGLKDVPDVGGKNASLGEMRRSLVPLGVRVPDGFATTADAYRTFLQAGGLEEVIDRELTGLDVRQIDRLQRAGRRVRTAILAAELPAALAEAVSDRKSVV